MKHQDIQGWFDFDDIYRDIIDKSNNNSVLVEVGAWKGKSIAFLADYAKNEKGILPSIYAVDTWEGSPDEPEHLKEIEKLGKDGLFNQFISNITVCGLIDIVNPMRMTSVEAAKKFPDKSIDFVFIDASHKYEDVLTDISVWFPKIKDGGVIAGHDLPWPDVNKAVKQMFGESYITRRNSWWKDIK